MLCSYRVAACSSEDGEHPVHELQSFHAQSRGWQSGRWCEFPQSLVLQFPGRVSLQQVQVLSHQFKIASRVELFIGSMPPGVPPPVTGAEGVEFSRLGHFSLDTNERSAYQARELKTVYVPRATEGTHLKLLLHKCHINEHNLYNQLGLLAVRAIGTGPGATGAVAADALALQAQATAAMPADPAIAHEHVRASMDPAVVAMVRARARARTAVRACSGADGAPLAAPYLWEACSARPAVGGHAALILTACEDDRLLTPSCAHVWRVVWHGRVGRAGARARGAEEGCRRCRGLRRGETAQGARSEECPAPSAAPSTLSLSPHPKPSPLTLALHPS